MADPLHDYVITVGRAGAEVGLRHHGDGFTLERVATGRQIGRVVAASHFFALHDDERTLVACTGLVSAHRAVAVRAVSSTESARSRVFGGAWLCEPLLLTSEPMTITIIYVDARGQEAESLRFPASAGTLQPLADWTYYAPLRD
jgi:hypothetical protein